MHIKEKAELSLLLDYYGAFLTERQRELTRMSADEDMSLAEIGEAVGVSRQCVRDGLVKAADKLAEFEEKLGLIERDRKLRALLDELECAVRTGADGQEGLISQIRSVLK